MPRNTAPGAGIYFGWNSGENGIANELDDNWLALSVLSRGSVLSRVTSLPASPSVGDVYLLTGGSEENQVAFRMPAYDNLLVSRPEEWRYLSPVAGMSVRVDDEGGLPYRFDGTAWTAILGSAATADAGDFDPAGTAASAVSTHEGEADPHPQYAMKVQNNLTATTPPGATDDASAGYSVTSLWFDQSAGEVYRCMDATAGAAVWVKTTLTLDELGSAATADVGDFDAAGSAQAAQDYAVQRGNHTGTQTLDTISDAGSAAAANTEEFDPAGAAGDAVSAHEASADPHSQYYNQARIDIWVRDKERQAFENATGGACTIERTTNGQACYMFVLPKTRWEDLVPSGELGTGVHEAFLESGVEKSELLIGMYQASTVNGELVSQARKEGRHTITWDASRTAAQSPGFDMMSNWEWSAIAFWCMANGFQPTGNTDFGRSHANVFERGVYDSVSGGDEYTLTGSGPNTWSHNNAANGIADLVGNRWEWQWGFKMVDGRIFLAPDNDKSLVESSWVDTGHDMPTASSSNWSGFYDSANEAPIAVRRGLIMPNGVADPDGSLWTNLSGERFPLRGGNRSDAANAGLGALGLNNSRGVASTSLGLRLSRLV